MHPVLFEIFGRPVYTYGTLLSLGFLAAYLYVYRRGRAIGMDADHTLNIFILIIISGVLGGRGLHVLHNLQTYIEDPAGIVRVWEGGMVFHGGLITGASAGILYVWWAGLPVRAAMDCFGPAIPLAHILGRLGCLGYGCCYGKVTDVPWALRFPPPVGDMKPRHPTQIYAALTLLVIALILDRWLLRPHRRGQILAGYLGIYGIARFCLEFIRGDNTQESYLGMGLSLGQSVSVFLVIASAVLFFVLRKYPVEPWPRELPSEEPRPDPRPPKNEKKKRKKKNKGR